MVNSKVTLQLITERGGSSVSCPGVSVGSEFIVDGLTNCLKTRSPTHLLFPSFCLSVLVWH